MADNPEVQGRYKWYNNGVRHKPQYIKWVYYKCITPPNSNYKASKKEIIHEITGEVLDVKYRNNHSCQLGEPLPEIGGDNADNGGAGHEIEDANAENGGILEIDVNAENGGAVPTEVRLFGQAIGHVVKTPAPVGTGSTVAKVVPPKTSIEKAGPSEIPAVTDAGEVASVPARSEVHLFGQLIGHIIKTPATVRTASTETVKVAEIIPAKTSIERAGPSKIPIFSQQQPALVGTEITHAGKVAAIPAKTAIEVEANVEIGPPRKICGTVISDTGKVEAVTTKSAIEIRAPSKILATVISNTGKVAAGTTKTAIEIEGPREIAGKNMPAPDGAASTVEPADSVNVVSGGSDPVKVTDVVAGEAVIANSEEMIPNTVMAATQFSLHGQMVMMAANVASGSVNGVESADNEREMTAN